MFTALPGESDILSIKSNLSEIANSGAVAQTESQKNLGLGDLATKNTLTAEDTSAVSVADKTLPAGTDLNTIIELGEYFQNVISNATLTLNYPEAVASALNGVDAGACR